LTTIYLTQNNQLPSVLVLLLQLKKCNHFVAL